jgi:hypothetical protein
MSIQNIDYKLLYEQTLSENTLLKKELDMLKNDQPVVKKKVKNITAEQSQKIKEIAFRQPFRTELTKLFEDQKNLIPSLSNRSFPVESHYEDNNGISLKMILYDNDNDIEKEYLCLSGQSDFDTSKYTTSCYYYCDNGNDYEMETETIQEMIDLKNDLFPPTGNYNFIHFMALIGQPLPCNSC